MKLDFPATGRNRDPILDVLRGVFADRRRVLEIAAGSGQHAVHMARHLPHLEWLPSDLDPEHLRSIAAWREESGLPNLLAPIALDASVDSWSVDAEVDAIFCANMIHIAPWAACLGLLQGAGSVLPDGGLLALYGPFSIDGTWNADSNRAFDASLRRRDPDWGVRDLTEVTAIAARSGLERTQLFEMPANNYLVVYAKNR